MDLPELSRRLANLIRVGTILAVDHAAGRARVRLGKIDSDWLPWLEQRAGGTVTWDPPTVGEQSLVFAPSGELAGGLILTGLPSDLIPQPSHDAAKHVTRHPDGAFVEYDHAAHVYRLQVPDGGKIILAIGATTLELRGDGVTLTTPDFEAVQS